MISFLIPFRDADGTRTRAALWVVETWRLRYPDAEFIWHSDDGLNPFNKSMAVNRAFAKSTGETIVILDADTIIDPVAFQQAITLVQTGQAPWAIPATQSWRLTKGRTLRLLDEEPDAGLALASTRAEVEQVAHVIGFCHILPRVAFQAVGGMDERFRGWGGEDAAFMMAVDAIVGHHSRVSSTLVSLWHDRPRDKAGRRIWLGQWSRSANTSFFRRYSDAKGSAELMRVALRERGAPLWQTSNWYRRKQQRSTGSMNVTFISRKLPALMIKVSADKKFKFSGGKLLVSGDDADLIRAVIAKRPEYGIFEVAQVEPVKVIATPVSVEPEPVLDTPEDAEPVEDDDTAPDLEVPEADVPGVSAD